MSARTRDRAAKDRVYDRLQRAADPALAFAKRVRSSAAWTRLRARALAAEPLCAECAREGRTEPAVDVDHVRALRAIYSRYATDAERVAAALDPTNLRPLCRAHHNAKTATERADARRGGRPRKPVEQITDPYWRRKREREAARERAPGAMSALAAAPPPYAILDPETAILCIPGYDPYRGADGFAFHGESARRAVAWIHEHCAHVKGRLAGQPLVLSPVEQAIVMNLFGWQRADGTRRYRECLIYVPRKFGKTLLAAAIALYVLFEDREEGAEIYLAASAQKQAGVPFRVAKRMALRDAYMRGRCEPYQFELRRLDGDGEQDDSFVGYIPASADTALGLDVHAFVLDELLAQRGADLYEALRTGMASRRQPLAICITTADFDRDSLCNERHDYAVKVRDGVVDDPEFLPVVFEASKDDDWRSEDTWRKANPHYPETPTREYMQNAARAASRSPAALASFLRYHLNVRTDAADPLIPLDRWDACRRTIDVVALRGKPCYGGLDLAATNDLCAFALVFPTTEPWTVLVRAWAPLGRAQERHERGKRPSYFDFADSGCLRLHEGDEVDYQRIREDIVALCAEFDVRDIGYDPKFAGEMKQQLEAAGLALEKFPMDIGSMNAPMKELMRRINRQEIAHDGDPVLRWCVGNTRGYVDANANIRPVKYEGAGRQRRMTENKIDLSVATVIAIGRALMRPIETPWSGELFVV